MTTSITLTDKIWNLVSVASVDFQVIGTAPVYICEAHEAPIDTDNKKIAKAGVMYNFTRVDGNFYAYPTSKSITIALDPVS